MWLVRPSEKDPSKYTNIRQVSWGPRFSWIPPSTNPGTVRHGTALQWLLLSPSLSPTLTPDMTSSDPGTHSTIIGQLWLLRIAAMPASVLESKAKQPGCFDA
jgi:hypothetical protein